MAHSLTQHTETLLLLLTCMTFTSHLIYHLLLLTSPPPSPTHLLSHPPFSLPHLSSPLPSSHLIFSPSSYLISISSTISTAPLSCPPSSPVYLASPPSPHLYLIHHHQHLISILSTITSIAPSVSFPHLYLIYHHLHLTPRHHSHHLTSIFSTIFNTLPPAPHSIISTSPHIFSCTSTIFPILINCMDIRSHFRPSPTTSPISPTTPPPPPPKKHHTTHLLGRGLTMSPRRPPTCIVHMKVMSSDRQSSTHASRHFTENSTR